MNLVHVDMTMSKVYNTRTGELVSHIRKVDKFGPKMWSRIKDGLAAQGITYKVLWDQEDYQAYKEKEAKAKAEAEAEKEKAAEEEKAKETANKKK